MSEIMFILHQLSKFDYENLRLKIEHWEQDNPTAMYLYQPFVSSEDSSNTSENDNNQTLLYIHQEGWQQELLSIYGNTISLMDATYKTTKDEMTLFLSLLELMLVTVLWQILLRNQSRRRTFQKLLVCCFLGTHIRAHHVL